MSQEGVDANTIPTAEHYTHTIRDLQKVCACVRALAVAELMDGLQADSHKAKYTEFVRRQRVTRTEVAEAAAEVCARVRVCACVYVMCVCMYAMCVCAGEACDAVA